MKPKILKLLSILLLLPFCIVLLGTGCEKDEDNSEYTEIGFFKFSDFGCENNNQWNMDNEYKDKNYVIKSQNEFEEIVNIECLTQIDFSTYIVLIGNKGFTTGAFVDNEEIKVNNSKIVYTVTLSKNDATVPSRVYYHAIIEKPDTKKEIEVVTIVKEIN